MKYSILYQIEVRATVEWVSVVTRFEGSIHREIRDQIEMWKKSLLSEQEIQFVETVVFVKLLLSHGPHYDLLLLNQEDGMKIALCLEGKDDWNLLEHALCYLGIDLFADVCLHEEEQHRLFIEQQQQQIQDDDDCGFYN